MQENIKQVIVKNTVRKEFKTAPIWQWDTGHILVFEGFDLPEAFQVHFAFSESGEAVTQIGSNDQVTVPDALVEDGRMIYAWLYISTEDAGLTKFVILMPVNRRAKPTHQVPPPVEHSEIEQAIVVLNAAVEKTETAAENAEQSEENASQYAENAYNSSEAAASAAESAQGDARTATQKAQEALTAALDADRKAQNASESAQLASQKASEASGYADGLAEAVRTANEAKQTAVNKATEANQSATNAAQKAQEALSSAQAAEGSANDADTAKRGAETAKDAAQGYAGNASIAAQTAGTAKDTAVQKAGEASQSATNAAQSAQAAEQTAQQFAQDITQLKSDIESKQDAPSVAGTEGQVLSLDANGEPVWANVQTESEIDDTAGAGVTDKTWSADKLVAELQDKADVIISSASGAIASFPDGAAVPVEKLVVNVEPVQDLHGYDSPWPAGGGDNLIPLTVDAIKAANGGANTWNGNSKTIYGVTYTILTDEAGNVTGINANGTATSTAKLKLGTIHAVSGTTYGIKKFNADDSGYFFGNINPRFSSATDANIYSNMTMIADSDKNVAVSYYIMAGGVADNLLITPFIAVASTAPTAFAPYSNECPISGWTGANVTRTGINVWDEEWEFGYLNINNGTEVATNNSIRMKNYIGVKPNTGYYFSCTGKSDVFRVVWFDNNKSFISASSASVLTNKVVTSPSGAYYMRCFFSSAYGNTYNNDISINYPATDTAYHQYSGTSLPVSWETEAGTVYGGTLTVNEDGTGTLVVDLNEIVFDGVTNRLSVASNTYIKSTYTRGYLSLSSSVADANRRGEIICDFFPTSTNEAINTLRPIMQSYSRLELNFFIGNNLTGIVYGEDTPATATTKMNNWLKTNPVKVLYPRATPLTFTLTAEQISGILRTLKGQNNIWADCGDIESVEYSADTKLYIDNQITKAIAAALNS